MASIESSGIYAHFSFIKISSNVFLYILVNSCCVPNLVVSAKYIKTDMLQCCDASVTHITMPIYKKTLSKCHILMYEYYIEYKKPTQSQNTSFYIHYHVKFASNFRTSCPQVNLHIICCLTTTLISCISKRR